MLGDDALQVAATVKMIQNILIGVVAFVSIGLETNIRELTKYLKGGKPLVLYVVGQSFNLCLTLLMVWVMFEKVSPHASRFWQSVLLWSLDPAVSNSRVSW
jgi:hypothetical protein